MMFQSDNAGCFTNLLVLVLSLLARQYKLPVLSYYHSETQDGKTTLDGFFGILYRRILYHVATVNDVVTPKQLVDAIMSGGGISNSTAVLIDTNRDETTDIVTMLEKTCQKKILGILRDKKIHWINFIYSDNFFDPPKPGDVVTADTLPPFSLHLWHYANIGEPLIVNVTPGFTLEVVPEVQTAANSEPKEIVGDEQVDDEQDDDEQDDDEGFEENIKGYYEVTNDEEDGIESKELIAYGDNSEDKLNEDEKEILQEEATTWEGGASLGGHESSCYTLPITSAVVKEHSYIRESDRSNWKKKSNRNQKKKKAFIPESEQIRKPFKNDLPNAAFHWACTNYTNLETIEEEKSPAAFNVTSNSSYKFSLPPGWARRGPSTKDSDTFGKNPLSVWGLPYRQHIIDWFKEGIKSVGNKQSAEQMSDSLKLLYPDYYCLPSVGQIQAEIKRLFDRQKSNLPVEIMPCLLRGNFNERVYLLLLKMVDTHGVESVKAWDDLERSKELEALINEVNNMGTEVVTGPAYAAGVKFKVKTTKPVTLDPTIKKIEKICAALDSGIGKIIAVTKDSYMFQFSSDPVEALKNLEASKTTKKSKKAVITFEGPASEKRKSVAASTVERESSGTFPLPAIVKDYEQTVSKLFSREAFKVLLGFVYNNPKSTVSERKVKIANALKSANIIGITETQWYPKFLAITKRIKDNVAEITKDGDLYSLIPKRNILNPVDVLPASSQGVGVDEYNLSAASSSNVASNEVNVVNVKKRKRVSASLGTSKKFKTSPAQDKGSSTSTSTVDFSNQPERADFTDENEVKELLNKLRVEEDSWSLLMKDNFKPVFVFKEKLTKQQQTIILDTYEKLAIERSGVEKGKILLKHTDFGEPYNYDIWERTLLRLSLYEWISCDAINFFINQFMSRKEVPLNVLIMPTDVYTTLVQVHNMSSEYVDRFLTRRLKNFLDLDKIIFPVNLHDDHWICVEIKPKERTIETLDSLMEVNHDVYQNMLKVVERAYMLRNEGKLSTRSTKVFKQDEWRHTIPTAIPVQNNGADCGIFTLMFIEALAKGIPLMTKTHKDVPMMRYNLVLDIMKKVEDKAAKRETPVPL